MHQEDNELQTLASQLAGARPRVARAPEPFRRELRTRLLTNYSASGARQPNRHRQLRLVSSLTILSLLLAFLWSSIQPRTLSAAEIMHRAAITRAATAADAEVLYERATVTVFGQSPLLIGMVAERWHSSDGTQLRYQLSTSDGQILFFGLRDRDTVWRSLSSATAGTQPVTQVYKLDTPEKGDIGDWNTRLLPHAFPASCDDLDCILSNPSGQYTLVGEEQLNDGRSVDILQYLRTLDMAGNNHTQTAVLKVDTTTFELVDVTTEFDGEPQVEFKQIERRALRLAELPEDLFSAIPPGLTVADADDGRAAFGGEDRVWIESISPSPGTRLEGTVEFEIVVGFELKSAPEALLRFEFVKDEFSGSISPNNQTLVRADQARQTIRFTANAAHLQGLGNEVKLAAVLGTWIGPSSFDVSLWEVMDEYSYPLR